MGRDLSKSSTQWSLIVRAQGEGPRARAALGQLIGRYEQSIVGMVRYFGYPPNQTAEEIKQEFLTRFLAHGDIATLDCRKGSFRGWLNRAVRNYLFNAWDAWNAQKNPDRWTDYPEAFDAMGGESPDHIVDREFALNTLSYVMHQLRLTEPDLARFDALRRFLPGPEWSLEPQAPIARELQLTVTALRKAIYDLRTRFKNLLLEAVADTLDVDLTEPAGKSEVEREVRLLYETLTQSNLGAQRQTA